MNNELIGRICHQANKAYCEAVGDMSQLDWDNAADWQKESAIGGVRFAMDNPDAGPDAQHNSWLEQKIKDGWVHGPVKDAVKKEHPCIVPYTSLPEFQQKKDALFVAIVKALK